MEAKKVRRFGQELDDVLSLSAPVELENNSGKELIVVPICNVFPDPNQPRKYFAQSALDELADSIKLHGILQPIIVRPKGERYEIIAGERRWRAATQAGLESVPVICCDVSDETVVAYALIENIQRERLNTIEEASALKRLVEEFSLTHEQVSKVVGKSRVMVSNLLRLLALSEPVKKLLAQNDIEMGHARALLSLDGYQQVEVAQKIIAKKLSVRETERLVSSTKLQTKYLGADESFDQRMDCFEIERTLEKKLGRKVRVKSSGETKVTVTLEFKTIDELHAYFFVEAEQNDFVVAQEAAVSN